MALDMGFGANLGLAWLGYSNYSNITYYYYNSEGLALTDDMVNEMAKQWLSRYGWVCPKCGRVYAPQVILCAYCNKKIKKEKKKNERY